MVGVAECLFFALTLARLPIQGLVWQFFGWPATQLIDPIVLALVLVAPIMAGVGFAWLLSGQRGTPTARWRLGLVGPYLWLASTLGLLVALGLEPVALRLDDSGRLLVFRIAFTLASGLAAFACTASVAATLRIDGVLPRAARTGAVTALTYFLVLLVVDQLPGWHVGGGDKAMVRVAMLGNLLAGTTGGIAAFRFLIRA